MILNGVIKMKKLYCMIAIICIGGLLLYSSASCEQNVSKDNENTEKNEMVQEDEPLLPEETTININFTDELSEFDFDGHEFSILAFPDVGFRHFYDVNSEEETGEILADTVYRRNRVVEDRLNVTIKDIPMNEGSVYTTLRNTVSAGDLTYDVAWLSVGSAFQAAQTGLLHNMYDVPNINLSKHYWDQDAVKSFTINNQVYSILGDISTSASMFTHLLAFNKKVAQDAGLDNLYQLVLDGKWTFDKLSEIIRSSGIEQDLNGDGAYDWQDKYVFSVSMAVFDALYTGSGERWVAKDSTGNLALSEFTPRKADVLDKIAQMFADTTKAVENGDVTRGAPQTLGKSGHYVLHEMFIEDRVLFVDVDIGLMMDYREMESGYGVLPLPKYDESQENYAVYSYPMYPMVGIPASLDSEQSARSGAVLEALASLSYTTLTPVFYNLALENKFTRDEESIAMLDVILRNKTFDIMDLYSWGNLRSMMTTAMKKNGGNYASIYESRQEVIDREIVKITETFK